jgi:isopentenyl phosphate kinase
MDKDNSRSSSRLVFLKLGGSLITKKDQPRTPRIQTLDRLVGEIAAALAENSALNLLLGHGAGSFGHVSADKYGTRDGVRTPEEWRGFAEVWWDASALNRLVMEALHIAGLPAIALPASASLTARDGAVSSWDLYPLKAALSSGLLPVVYGDVIFDVIRGGTILSTEELFAHLAEKLHPEKILLAGIEPGVWRDFPACTELVREITPGNISEVIPSLGGSRSTDVTGGMASKVVESLELVRKVPGLEVEIFSGEEPGKVLAALLGKQVGTAIRGHTL